MNIIFLSRSDPKNINIWSGTLYHIYNKLKEKHNIEIIGIEILNQLTLYTKGNLSENVFIFPDRYVRTLNTLLSERINAKNCDLLFFGDLFFVPFLEIRVPIVYLSDITFDQLRPYYRKPDEKRDKFYMNLEELLFEKSFKIIFSSEWIMKKAVERYQLDFNKINIVEFGANISTPQNFSIDMNMDICRLVFIGTDWKRKGGDIVLQTYQILKKKGLPCTLTIIGSTPEDEPEEDENLTIIPRLDKSIPEDLKRLNDILSESHFLVLPTRFDAFGIVFCEASAYALPSITANVGGVSQAVKEGKNGFLLPADATAQDYAEKIITVFCDKDNYINLRQSSRIEFETRLNWDVWGEKVNKILENTVREWKQL